jgi:hypothetical protein
VPATLTIPFAALTAFVDPGVQFSLPFKEMEDVEGAPRREDSALQPTPMIAPDKPKQTAPAEAEKPDAEKPAAAPGEVVSLDSFRKK